VYEEVVVTREVVNIIAENNSSISNVFITGATGFLGIHILDELMNDEAGGNVYCLVRGKSQKDAERKMQELLEFYFGKKYLDLLGSRIFVVNGDLTLDRFGLSELEYSRLGEKIDNIIHAAASVKHFGKYSDFEKINVLGTEEIIKFSSKFDKKMNHISTLSVAGCGMEEDKGNREFSEKDFYIGQNYMYNVYVRSKFEAEKLVFKSINSGLKATIFRVGNLTGRYSDGQFQKNIYQNNFYRIIKSILELGTVSEKMSQDIMEFTPVDYCARGIIKLLKNVESNNKVYHLFNHKTLRMSDFFDTIKNLTVKIKVLEDCAFEEFLASVSLDKTKKNILSGVINYFAYKNISENSKAPVLVTSEITIDQLKGLGFEWPEVDERYIKDLINYMVDAGFLADNIH
jgi:thioester reductase-like protein